MVLGSNATSATASWEARAKEWPLVSAIVVEDGGTDAAAGLVESLRACSYPTLEIVLVADQRAEPKPPARTASGPRIVRVSPGCGRGANSALDVGIARASGELLLFLDGDARVEPDFLEPMVLLLRGDLSVGIVSPKVVSAEAPDVIQYAGARVSRMPFGRGVDIGRRQRDVGQYDGVRDTDLPHETCALICRDLFDACWPAPLPQASRTSHGWRQLAKRARGIGYRVMFCGYSTVACAGDPNPRTGVAHELRARFARVLGRCRRAWGGVLSSIRSVRAIGTRATVGTPRSPYYLAVEVSLKAFRSRRPLRESLDAALHEIG